MIRIGIVGCGRILAAHLRGYLLLREAGVDDFRITALCARNENDAQMYVQRGSGPDQRAPVGTSPGDPLAVGDVYLSDFQDDVDVQVFTDYGQMIEQAPIDAVNDFTTHALHHQVARAAFDAGKHLLTQKPLAVSVAAGRAMCAQAAERDLVLGVFENARNREDTRQLGWLFDSRITGALKMILMMNVGNWWAPDRIVADTPWRHERLAGGGISLDIGVHLFNHFRYVAGEMQTVTAHTEVQEAVRRSCDSTGRVIREISCDADDTLWASFRSERGVRGSVVASWSGHGAATTAGSGRGTVYYAERGSVQGDELTADDGSRRLVSELYAAECDPEQRRREFPLDITDSFALNQYDWLSAIRAGRQPETSGSDGLRDLAAAYAALESSLAQRTVHVDEVLNGDLREYQRAIDERYGLTKC